MKLKVCGVRTMAMLQACQDLSVPYVGFNFVPTSKRKIDLSTAQPLSQAYTGKKVGVFQNQSVAEILQTLSVVDLDIVQLHGEEPVEFIKTLRENLPDSKPIEIWKGLKVDQNTNENEVPLYSKTADLILFDGAKPGSGTTINAAGKLKVLINQCQVDKIPYAVAGGINVDNAEAFLDAYPEAALLDSASGVETNHQFNKIKLERLLSLLEDA